MDQPIASSSRLPAGAAANDPRSRMDFEPASQAQILRAYQRDSAQVYRLTELVSEIIRSIAGTRWLAHKQLLVDLLTKGVYLTLTFGRGTQTLGEEYTDIFPRSARRRGPSAPRRIITIFFLLLPSLLISPTTLTYLRNSSSPPSSYSPSFPGSGSDSRSSSRVRQAKARLLRLLESPIGKILPELHMIAFLFSGRFFEFARRLTGLSYISTLPPKPPGQRAPSYEPLGLLMLLPLAHRLLSNRTRQDELDPAQLPDLPPQSSSSNTLNHTLPPLSPSLTPPLTGEETLLLTAGKSYDTPNTYLSAEAVELLERQCTLCLEPRGTGEGSGGTVAVTECGHVFCWGCLGGLEKLECPLCRQALRMERLVAAYNL